MHHVFIYLAFHIDMGSIYILHCIWRQIHFHFHKGGGPHLFLMISLLLKSFQTRSDDELAVGLVKG